MKLYVCSGTMIELPGLAAAAAKQPGDQTGTPRLDLFPQGEPALATGLHDTPDVGVAAPRSVALRQHEHVIA